jgi:hypothetical protein
MPQCLGLNPVSDLACSPFESVSLGQRFPAGPRESENLHAVQKGTKASVESTRGSDTDKRQNKFIIEWGCRARNLKDSIGTGMNPNKGAP